MPYIKLEAMNMKLKNNVNPDFNDLFSFNSKEEEIDHEAKVLMFQFLDRIQTKAEEQGLNRKQLAEKIGTSASYITQLFRGDKLINLSTIAKFQKELGVKFGISMDDESGSLYDKDIALNQLSDRDLKIQTSKQVRRSNMSTTKNSALRNKNKTSTKEKLFEKV